MFTLFHELLALMGRGLSFFYDLVPSYGLAIILLTVAVRLVMLPLTIKQTRSMQEMQKLQPEVKRLQAKYKGGDRQKMNEEMMKLYKEHKVNPLGGCLPLLLQLPIFLALYRVFAGCGAHNVKVCPITEVGTKYLPTGSALTRAIDSGKAGFLGMNLGLAPMAALKDAGSFPGSLVHVLPYFLLILLMVGTTWYQQKQIQAVSTGQQAQQMQMMGKIMPLVLGVFSLNLPAGVSIYWVASNVWTIVQQRFILGKTATATSPGGAGPATGGDAGTAAGKGSDAPAKSGGLLALLREQRAEGAAAARDKATAKPAPKPQAKPAAKDTREDKNKPAEREKTAARDRPTVKPKPAPKPAAGGAKAAPNRRRPPARSGNAPAGAKATTDGKAKDASAGGNGTTKPGGAPGESNGKTPTAGGKPVGAGASARPRNTSAKKRRRR
ncbi:MAG TPA: membrane protein insertase YidC [Actinomycetota bacterium]|nr:membrane protein insertase YidC [Actinomycetota bacterium]